MMTAASRPRRAAASPGCPVDASWIACAARPGGSQRIQLSMPAKLAGLSCPEEAARGITWMRNSNMAKIGMNRKTARSLPRRERSSPANPVVTNRASTMQNST